MKILGIAINGKGLGHFNRVLGILRAFKALNPSTVCLLLTKADFISHANCYSIPVIKLPNSSYIGALDIDFLKNISRKIISEFNPDIVLLDTRVDGLYGELLDSFLLEKYYVAFIRRPVKQGRAKEIYKWLKFIDHLLILPEGEKHITDKFLEKNVRTVSYVPPITILDEAECYPKEEALKAIGVKEEKSKFNILVTTGGTGLETSTQNTILELLSQINNVSIWNTCPPISSTGCECRSKPKLRNIHFVPLMKIIRAFDLVVTTAGYNTVHELYKLKVPAVFIPVPRELDDQQYRAIILSKQFPTLFSYCSLQSLSRDLIPTVKEKLKNFHSLKLHPNKQSNCNIKIARLIINQFVKNGKKKIY